MLIRFTLALAIASATPFGAAAAVPCDLVRSYAKLYTVAQMEQWARSNGYSASQIKAAKRCLR